MNTLATAVFSSAFVIAAAHEAVPLVAASTGEIVSERAGIVNIGLEAMILAGAFGGAAISYATGNVWIGLLAGAISGLLVAALHGVIVIHFDGDQVVSGVAINIAILGLTTYLARLIFHIGGAPTVPHFTSVSVPTLAKIPLLGPLLFSLDPAAYLALGAVVPCWLLLQRTRWGLETRACGESPSAADALGVPVSARRWQALLACGTLAGIGGVYLSLSIVSTFTEGMSAGRGYIALAVVIASRWNPLWAVVIALLFGGATAIGYQIQAVGANVPFQLMRALPYVATLIVYAGLIGRVRPPAALGQRWLRA